MFGEGTERQDAPGNTAGRPAAAETSAVANHPARNKRGIIYDCIYLLTGVTGLPSEVKKIASLIEKIRPARVQINTVSRPPAEEFAFPVPLDRLRALKELIPGYAEIIAEENENTPTSLAPHEADEMEILALLSRRPCTAEDIAEGLGLHLAEALKCLETLTRAGKVTTTIMERRISTSLSDICIGTVACGNMLTEMIKGMKVDDALKIQPEDVINKLGGVPKESEHCAKLAVITLKKALADYEKYRQAPWKRAYEKSQGI